MIRPAVLLAVTVLLMASARSFLAVGEGVTSTSGVALGFGFLVLAAIQAGNLFATVRLPRLTGYLLTGLACGPEVSGLLTPRMVDSLQLVNGVAVGLIALSAGSELNIARLRPRLRTIVLVGALSIPLALVASAALTLIAGQGLPFLNGFDWPQRIAVAVVLGVVFASLSPAVALGILSETGSAGPLSETTLGVVVLADVVIIVLFAGVHAAASGVFGTHDGGMNPATQVTIEVFGSIGIGIVVGAAMALYIRRVKSKVALFVIAVCVVSAQVGSRLHLDVLIICLTAGLMMENVFGVRGEVVARELGPAVLPVFAVFFAVAGARLHLGDLARIWPLAIAFAFVRGTSLVLGTTLGTRLSNAEPVVRKWLPYGLLPQAGVSVGLAVLLERHFPTWGPGAKALVLSVITINEMIGPILLRHAFVGAGEVGKRVDFVAAEH